MEKQPIERCDGWRQHQIVFEAPKGAKVLLFGAWLRGPAELWVDDFSFDPAAADAATTTWPLLATRQLDFEDSKP